MRALFGGRREGNRSKIRRRPVGPSRQPMRTHYIIDSAATLLGVSLVIVTGVHISGMAATSIADELSFVAALLFLGACAVSHLAIIRSDDRFERIADRIFAAGLVMLLFGALSFWF
jgi:hypothetical protein